MSGRASAVSGWRANRTGARASERAGGERCERRGDRRGGRRQLAGGDRSEEARGRGQRAADECSGRRGESNKQRASETSRHAGGERAGRAQRTAGGGVSGGERSGPAEIKASMHAGERGERRASAASGEFSKSGINECPFHLAFWSAEAAGDVVAGPLVITAPVGACGGSAERQKRAAREHGPRTAGRLTCRCVYFWGLTLVGLVRATDGRGTSALQLVLTRGDEGGRRRAAAALASAPTSVCRNDTSSPDGAMHHRPFEKTKDFFFQRGRCFGLSIRVGA